MTVDLPPDMEQTRRPSNVRWLVFGLSCATSFVLYLHRYSWNIIGPKLQEEGGLSHTQVGLLFSLFYYTYALGQIPSGLFIDRFGPHRFLTAIIAAWSLALAVIAQVSQLFLIGLARLIFGATQAGCYPALTKISQTWFPFHQRTVLQGLVATAFGRAGGAMSPIILMTLLIGSLGMHWRMAVTMMTAIGLILCLLVALLMRDSPLKDARVNTLERDLIRSGSDDPPSTSSAQTPTFSKLVSNRTLRWFTIQQFLDAGSDIVFVGLIGSYFLAVHNLDIKQTGWIASLPLWGGALGGITGGWLNDRLIRQSVSRRWVRSGVGFVGKLIGCFFLVMILFQNDGTSAGLLLMVAKFFSDWSQPTTWGVCTDIGRRFSATVFSIINTAGTLGGVLMPIVFGQVLDLFTTKSIIDGVTVSSTDWTPLFCLLAGMYFFSGVCWLWVDCTNSISDE